MKASDTHSPPDGHQLKSELARYCLPATNRDPNRNLAWVNSICFLFLVIGLFGGRLPVVSIKVPPPIEEVIPTIIEAAPPPAPTETQKAAEPSEQEKADISPVVVVTPDAPSIAFSVPTVGNLVAPAALARAPLATVLTPVETVKSRPTAIESTGAAGDRPQPPYPKIALQQGQQGSVVLQMTADENGVITSIQVKESSGYPLLDRSTLEFVKKHWPLPPGTGSRVFETTITYKILTN